MSIHDDTSCMTSVKLAMWDKKQACSSFYTMEHHVEHVMCWILILPAECAPVTQTTTNKREHRGSLVKTEPEKDKHVSNSLGKKHQTDAEGPQILAGTSTEKPKHEMEVSPEPSKSSASPMDQKKPLVKMMKVKSKKCRYVSKIWRKLVRKHRVVPEGCQVQVDTSVVRPQSKMEVSPEPPNSTTSPEYQRKHPIRKVKVKSAKHKYGPKMWRKLYRKCHRIPKDSNEAQVQADTSIARQRSEVEGPGGRAPARSTRAPARSTRAPARRTRAQACRTRAQARRTRALARRTRALARRTRAPAHRPRPGGRAPARRPWRQSTGVQAQAAGHRRAGGGRAVQVAADQRRRRKTAGTRAQPREQIAPLQLRQRVLPEPPNSATSPEYQRKHSIRKVKVKSRKCRYVSKIWRKFLWNCFIVPKDPKGLQVQAGTSTERSKSEVEGSYASSKSVASTVDQRNPPVRAVKVISKKHRFVSTLLKIISRKRPVIPLGVDTPQVTVGPSRKTAQIKTEVVHKNADTALSPMVKVGYRKRRCIPAILREFCEKQHMKVEVSALLKRVHWNSMMVSKEMPEPNVTTAETTLTKMEELPDHADTTVTPHGPGTMVKVKCKKVNWISSLFKRFWKKTPVTSRDVEVPPAVETTLVRTPEAQRKGLSNVPDIKQIFFREEEFDHYNEGAWEDYQSYFPDGIPTPESRHSMVSTMVGSYIAQVGDTDIEDQQNFDSKESFPDAFEVQQWELRKESSIENPVLNVLFLAPPKPSDEDVVIIKRKRKKKRRRYY